MHGIGENAHNVTKQFGAYVYLSLLHFPFVPEFNEDFILIYVDGMNREKNQNW